MGGSTKDNLTRWKQRTVLFLISQNISLFGSMLVQYVILWHITLTTRSGFMMTIAILSAFIPTLLISPFAGVWADRFDRKMVIIVSDGVIAITTLGMAIIFHLGLNELWQLFVVLAIRSLGTGVQTPAVSALLPQLVPSEHLTMVNGIQSSVQSFVTIISPVLSGALYAFSPIEYVFGIDVVTAIIAITILLYFLQVPSHRRASQQQPFTYGTDIRDGIMYIHRHRFIKVLFIYCACYFVLFSPAAFLSPLQTARTYGTEVWRLSAIEVAFSGGMMLGGLVIAWWGGFTIKIHSMILSTFISSLCILGFGVAPHFSIYLMLMGVVGIAMPIFNTPFTVLLQQQVDEAYLGRVFSVFTMISSSMMPLAMLIFGPLSDSIRIEWLLLATGLSMLVVAAIMLRDRRLIESGSVDQPPGE